MGSQFGGDTLAYPADSPVIHDVSRAAKTFIGTRLLKRKSFLCQIKKLVEASNLDNLLTLRNVCIFLLAEFAGFFRIEEVLHIKSGL